MPRRGPIVVRDNPPWVAVPTGAADALHRALAAAGFGASPPVECGAHGHEDGLGRFACIELEAGTSAREVESWLAVRAGPAVGATEAA